jgi:uncharacterized protein (DUF427 family)
MTDEQLNDLFTEFWAESYPNAKPGIHAITTHIAFAKQVLEVYALTQELNDDSAE